MGWNQVSPPSAGGVGGAQHDGGGTGAGALGRPGAGGQCSGVRQPRGVGPPAAGGPFKHTHTRALTHIHTHTHGRKTKQIDSDCQLWDSPNFTWK